MTNIVGGLRHMALFKVTAVSPAGEWSGEAVVQVDLSKLTDCGDAVQVETRYGRCIWLAWTPIYKGHLQSLG